MKHVIFTFFILAFSYMLNAQICNPPCTPDPSVNENIPGNGIFSPLPLPPAIEGVYYEESITIIPPSTYSGLPVIVAIQVDEVNGLPEGMAWCKSQEKFDVTSPLTRYCAQLKGTPTTPGDYQLSLKITPYIGYGSFQVPSDPIYDDTSLLVIVLPHIDAPVADFSANTTNIDAGQQVQFTDLSSNNPTTWAWTFQGGTPPASSQQNPTISYMTPGTYDVSLTATNEGGENNTVKTGYITVNDPTGIYGESLDFIKIYPNPAYDNITVEAIGLEAISIIDVLGKIVYTTEANSDKESIDISKLQKANYFVKVKTNSGEIVKTISIK